MKNDKFQELVIKHLTDLSKDDKVLKSSLSRVETRMENQVVDKIQVLFEGYKQHEDKLNRIEHKLNTAMEKLSVHDVQIKLLINRS